MRIDLYHVDQCTWKHSVEVLDVELDTCFPDDPADAALAAEEIERSGEYYYGGGAAPLFYFRKAACHASC